MTASELLEWHEYFLWKASMREPADKDFKSLGPAPITEAQIRMKREQMNQKMNAFETAAKVRNIRLEQEG